MSTQVKSKKLHEILAIEKGVKTRSYAKIDEMQHVLKKPDMFNGHHKRWIPLTESSEMFPPDNKKIQAFAPEMLGQYIGLRKEVFDLELSKDLTNAGARADIIIDDEVIASELPATTLLFLEKELTDLRTFISAIPVLDAAENWSIAPNNPFIHQTAPEKVSRTKKVEKALVMYEATKDHPAQVKTVVEDVIIGTWETVKTTSAISVTDKLALWQRVNLLVDAVKQARERANGAIVVERKLGSAIFDFVLGKKQ
jgi:hypothetical protein